MKLTRELLRKMGACVRARVKFGRVFPGGTTVTIAALKKASAAGLEVSWLAGMASVTLNIPSCRKGECKICDGWRKRKPSVATAAKAIRKYLKTL